jgi:hypothetical protein
LRVCAIVPVDSSIVVGDRGNLVNVPPFERIGFGLKVFEELLVRILFVEDDQLVGEFVVDALREGLRRDRGKHRRGGPRMCKQQAADVLVTDIKLPGAGRRVADRRTLS